MRQNRWLLLGLSMALVFTIAACSGQEAEESASPSPDPTATPAETTPAETTPAESGEGESEEAAATLTLTAGFEDEAGAALADTTIRFTVGDTQAEYLTAEDGTLTVASLPLEGTVEVAVLDDTGAETSSTALDLSEGSVTDVTEADGSVSVTLLTGTDTLSLTFIQQEDGTLTCALNLSGEGDA